MATSSPPNRIGKLYQPISTIESLHENLQWALSGELSAIPPYLCAMYSLRDPTSDTYQTIRSVVIEEMLHMMQVANLLNATGACPSLSAQFVPSYPGYMLHHAVGGPRIELQAYSPVLARSVFMSIEQPETSLKMPDLGQPFDTVGQFYRAIKEGFVNCVNSKGEEAVFPQGVRPQIGDTYFGPGGGRLVKVTDLDSAKRAIKEITEQGEGAFSSTSPQAGEEPFGGFEHYGQRVDGTYGPILGGQWEMSHYRKFQQLADAQPPSPAVYPMQANPSADSFSGPAKDLARLFNGVYVLMLQNLERMFQTGNENWFFQIAFPLMRYALAPLATLLMQTPLNPGVDLATGPNAGPPFAYVPLPDADMVALPRQLTANCPDSHPIFMQLWQKRLGQASQTIEGALKAAQALLKKDENGGPACAS